MVWRNVQCQHFFFNRNWAGISVIVWLLWPCTQELWKANGPIGTKYRIMYMELLWVHWQISIKPCKVLPCILWVATGLISKLLWQANTFSGSLFPRNVSIVKSVCYRSTMIRTATHSTPPLTAATFFRLWDSSVHPLHATISSMHSCTIPRCSKTIRWTLALLLGGLARSRLKEGLSKFEVA